MERKGEKLDVELKKIQLKNAKKLDEIEQIEITTVVTTTGSIEKKTRNLYKKHNIPLPEGGKEVSEDDSDIIDVETTDGR